MRAFAAIVGRDLSLAYRAGGGALQGVLFFALAALIYALAFGPDVEALARLAVPIVWASALLATLVSIERIFEADAEDGSLDVMIETSDLLEGAFLAKAAAHWLATAPPLLVAAPVVGLFLNLPSGEYLPLALSLLIGTPALSLLGALAGALTLSLRRTGVLASVLVAPLFAPVVIFGAGAAAGGPGEGAALMFLGAVTMFSLIVAPLAGAAAIRLHMS